MESASNYPAVVFLRKFQNIGGIIAREALTVEQLRLNTEIDYQLTPEQRLKFPAGVIPINVSQDKTNLVIKLLASGKVLGELVQFSEGIRIPASMENEEASDYMIVKQYQFEQWSTIAPGTYISKADLDQVMSETSDRFVKTMQPKILVAEDALKISATFDERHCIPQGGIYFGVAENPWFMLGLLNSSLLSTIYRILYGGMHMGGGYLRYRKNFLESLPIAEFKESDISRVASLAKEIFTENSASNELPLSLLEALDSAVLKMYEIDSSQFRSVVEA